MTDTKPKAEYLSPKLMKRYDYYSVPVYCHWCSACKSLHGYAVDAPFPSNGAQWSYNGNAAAPDFKPSMNISWGWPNEPQERCHYFVTNGTISYCGDSTHALSGQTLELPDIPDQQWLYAGITPSMRGSNG
jgi:hypothetical protein